MPPGDPKELLPVVDGRDRVIAYRPRDEIHLKGLLHRAVHVLVFAPDGRLYLQKRSQAKDTHPGKWTTSASGHVDPGESYARAARRELAEELGLDGELTLLGGISANAATEGEFTRVYICRTRGEPVPDPHEIEELGLFSLDEARFLAADLSRAAPCLAAVLDLLAAKARP